MLEARRNLSKLVPKAANSFATGGELTHLLFHNSWLFHYQLTTGSDGLSKYR